MIASHYLEGLARYAMQSMPLWTTGAVKFVHSSHALADDSPSHGSLDRPYGSLDYANTKLTAGAGDTVVVLPGHVETVTAAAGLALTKANTNYIGLGSGAYRPTINFTTATTADMDVDAEAVTMVNFLFTGGIDALVAPIDINAADFKLLGCETRDVTGETVDFIAADTNADRLLIDGWIHRGAAADGGDSALNLVGCDDVEVKNFQIYGNFDNGAIESVTTACLRARIHNGHIWTEAAEDLAIIMHADSTGTIGPNIVIRLQDHAANIDECLVGEKMHYFDPIYIVNLDAEKGMLTPRAATTDA